MYSLFILYAYMNIIQFFLKTILLIYIFNIVLPYLYEYLCSLTINTHTICINMVNILYFYPMFIILYIIHNIKLNRQLSLLFINYNNPNHIYLTVLLLFIYMLLNILSLLNYYIGYVFGVVSYIIYVSQLCYDYIPIHKLEYTNYVDFLNQNIVMFIPSGFIITYILIDIKINYYILMSYIIILLNTVLLIYSNLWVKKSIIKINILLPFETIFSKILSLYGTKSIENIKTKHSIIHDRLNRIS